MTLGALVVVAMVSSSLPPDPLPEPRVNISCDHVKKLVALFGEARVIEEARNRKVSQEAIDRIRRRCLR